MRRINTTHKAADLFGPGKDGFRNGDMGTGIMPTELNAEWFNMLQEEIAAVIEAAGLALNSGNSAQLLEAIKRMIDIQAGNYALDTGAANAYVVALDPAVVAYADGMTVRVKAVNANTGASTLNTGGGVKSLVNDAGGALGAGDIPAGGVFTATYILAVDKFYITSLVQSQGDARYAAIGGSASQAFLVAQASLYSHALSLGQQQIPFRNRVINGDMSVSQVNGSTLVTTGIATNTYVIDQMIVNAATAAVTAGQSTDATGLPIGAIANLKIAGAASNAGVKVKHRMEAKDVAHFAGKRLAISFYAYQDSGAAFASATVKAYCPTTTADTFSALTQEGSTQTISIANAGTIAKYTAFITMGASNVAKGLEIEIDTAAGLLAGKTMYVTQLQVEAVASDATTGTEFEYIPYAENLSRCQRYLPVFSGSTKLSQALIYTATISYCVIQFLIPTRVAPTGIFISSAAHFGVQGVAAYGASAVTFNTASKSSGEIQLTITGATAGQAGISYCNNASGILYFTGAQL